MEAVYASAQDVVPTTSREHVSQETVEGTHQVVPGWTMVAVVG